MRQTLGMLVVGLILAGCSSSTVSTTTVVVTTTTTVVASATAAEPIAGETDETVLAMCPELDYRPTVVPAGAADDEPEVGAVATDEYTSIPGTSVRVWTDGTGDLVMVFLRGALPPHQWVGPAAQIEVLGREAALGRLPDDVWAVAWYESEDRCDYYTLVVYPPTSAEELRTIAGSIIPSR